MVCGSIYAVNIFEESIMAKKPNSPPPKTKKLQQDPNAIYVLDVFIIDAPITEAFANANPIMSRRIEIQGSNTLQELHKIIFKAFDRSDEHMYEFQLSGSEPGDPKAQRYTLKSASGKKAGEVSATTIDALGLSIDEHFAYLFDFGDEWWHQVDVMAISEPNPKGKYPKITQREGASPPQYADMDNENDE
jgi:Plasmid pRiA4b ORF-3-like protein